MIGLLYEWVESVYDGVYYFTSKFIDGVHDLFIYLYCLILYTIPHWWKYGVIFHTDFNSIVFSIGYSTDCISSGWQRVVHIDFLYWEVILHFNRL